MGAVQAVTVALVLLWASGFKLLARSAPTTARRSALRQLVGEGRVVSAYRAVGVAEAAVALALLVPATRIAGAVGAVGLSVGMLGYLAYARKAAPESSCGCLSDKVTPVNGRHFARAGVLLAASLGAVLPGAFTLVSALVVVVELAVVAMLSPELDDYWLMPLRRFRVRLSHPLARRSSFEVPLDSTVTQLTRSDAYRSVQGMVRSDLLDSWDEGEWRILTYAARRDTGPVTVVFAVPLLRYDPDDVRVVLVEDESEVVEEDSALV
ncbi:MauE/DoxX family redox-associated membrane protein [Actinokineospora sp.]|uniref:MauE/DoxX family redox-associated membrane protein n=1 Tax=Actinokineospora sp. TaxID=1872133 RepID=UPI004037FBAB